MAPVTRILRCLVFALVVAGCSPDRSPAVLGTGTTTTPPARLSLRIVARHPHDPTGFTEGLAFGDAATLYESSGRYGSSQIRVVDPDSGVVRARAALAPDQFAEGLAPTDGRVVQLTWREHTARTWSVPDLRPGPTYSYDNEGWGLTAADGELFQSDGTSTVTVRDAQTFAVRRTLRVTRGGRPVERLNELEWVDGVLWANVWKSTDLLRIDPRSGRVTGVADLTRLVPPGLADHEAVANGIAHRPGDPDGRLWVTGKEWPTMYVVDVGG